MRLRAGLTVLLATLGILLTAGPAHAATDTCRQLAREVHAAVQRDLRANPADDAGASAEFNTAYDRRPDCQAELATLAAWYRSGATTDFPFKAEDDPAKGFLGPVGWWWNTIYVSMFNRSALMMVMFGWELFLTPILLALALVAGVLGAAVSPLRRRRQPGSP